jgi:hypothetical protein
MRSLCGLVVFLLACSTAVAGEEEKNGVVHGTIDVVLANKNGMVVLTDSMLTADGKQLLTPGKKLFRLDDLSVCAIAGIIATPSGSYRELDLSTVAIIDDYARKVSVGPPVTIVQKLRELTFLLNVNLSAVENIQVANGKSLNPDRYTLQLTVAGYDTDGILKIGKVTLRSRNSGGYFDSAIESGGVRPVQDRLEKEFSGMPDKADSIMAHPEAALDDEAVSTYAASLKQDGGKSLGLEQMIELATRLKYYSSIVHPEVGGPNQIAILQDGKITSFSQPAFANSAPALKFSLVVASSFSRSGVLFTGSVIFVRCSWDFIPVPIDGRFFISNEFRNVLLIYNGGPLHFDATNKIIDSDLVVGRAVTQYSNELKDVRLRVLAGRSPSFDPKALFPLITGRQ